jgi:type IV secretory pathway TraG/TraD family ATPase VirD4
VWLSVRRVIEPFLDPTLRELCSPRPGQGFDARAHIAQGGSLFLIAGQHQAAHAVPVLTALTEHWLTTAQQMGLEYPTRRLDPPATAVLDELCNATPIPQLPDIISDSAGRGVIVHWAAQSAAQLEDTFSPVRARSLLDNTTTMSVWGGLKDARTLEWISTLSGHRERMRWQQFSDGLLQPGRSSLGTETVPTYRAGEIRTIGPGRVLVIHRNLDPILARAIDVSSRPDWRQLRHDVELVRSGYVDVDVNGFPA